MRAAVVESFGKLVVRDIPSPTPGPYQARCQMLFGTVCSGTDTHLLQGDEPFCYWVKPPFVLGHESVGRVVEIGPKVRHLKLGDVVTRVGTPGFGDISSGWGGFAEFGIATDWRAMREDDVDGWQGSTAQQVLPSDIDPAHGTLFITWRETLSYVTRMGIGAGMSVLVIGSGGNALAFASHARNLGAARVAVVGSGERETDSRRAGASNFYNYRDADCWQNLADATPGSFDFVIDSIGKTGLADQGLKLLKPGGTIGIYGFDGAGKTPLDPNAARGTFTVYRGNYDEAEAHEAVLAFYLAGKLDPAVWFDRSKPIALSNITDALNAVRSRAMVKPLVQL